MAAGETEWEPELRDAWRGRCVALTGATGFLGQHLTMLLRDLGADITAIVRPTSKIERLQEAGVRCRTASLSDVNSLTRAIAGSELCFHVAGAVDFQNDYRKLFEVNVEGTTNFLRAAKRAGVSRVVATSSIVAVGASLKRKLLNESAEWNLGPLDVPYVTTKHEAEQRALAENSSSCEVVVVNPASVIGPDDFSGSEFGVLCNRFWRGRLRLHFGGGNNYVDVRDVAMGHLLAATRGRPGERYLLSGVNLSANEFFTRLERAARRRIFRLRLPNAAAPLAAWLGEWLARRKNKTPLLSTGLAKLVPYFFFFDNTKARHDLGWGTRPIDSTLGDAFTFWMQPKAKRHGPLALAG